MHENFRFVIKWEWIILGPDEGLISCVLAKMDSNRYEVTYTPDSIGMWIKPSSQFFRISIFVLGDFQIEVFQDDIPIDDNTYTARAYDINQVAISDFPSTSIVDAATHFISKVIVK